MATVDQASVDPALKAVQMRKARYAIFRVAAPESSSSSLSIVLERQSERSATYRELLRELKDNAPRFITYDYEHSSADGRPTSSLYCLYWMPQQVNQQERILYSSGKANFVAYLSGYRHFTAEDKDELKEILENEQLIPKKE